MKIITCAFADTCLRVLLFSLVTLLFTHQGLSNSLMNVSKGQENVAMVDSTILDLLRRYPSQFSFEPNIGSWNSSIQYRIDLPGVQVNYLSDAISFTLYSEDIATKDALFTPSLVEQLQERSSSLINGLQQGQRQSASRKYTGHTYHLTWLNHNPQGNWFLVDQHAFKQHAYFGNKKNESITYGKELWRKDIYKDIDIRYYSSANEELEYDYIVHPGADLKEIKFEIVGAERPYLNRSGYLVYETSMGEVSMSRPYSYQVIEGVEQEVPSSYVIHPQGYIYFEIDESKYNPSLPLIIDPVAVKWSGYQGGRQSDILAATQVDDTGIYALFSTLSPDFPITPGAFQIALSGNQDLAVVRIDLSGNRIWSSFIGGSQFESANSIRVDNESVYIVAESSSDNYPVTPGAFQPNRNGFSNLVLSCFSKENGTLSWSTYLGGSTFEFGAQLAIDAERIYVMGYTGSTDFPVSADAFQSEPLSGGDQAFISSFRKNGNLAWSTYFSAGGINRGAIIISDAQLENGMLYITGQAPQGLPLSPNAVATANGGEIGGYLSVFNASTGQLSYSSFLQNAGDYAIYQMALHDNGIILYGSSDRSFVVSSGAFQSMFAGGIEDLLLLSLDKTNYQIQWSTFAGGSSREQADYAFFDRRNMIIQDSIVFIAARTHSRNFPVSTDAWQRGGEAPAGQKFVLASFNAQNGQNNWSTYLSNASPLTEDDILLLRSDERALYAAGRTRSDGHFTSASAFQTTRFGNFDLVLNEINPQSGHPSCGSYLGGQGNETLNFLAVLNGDMLVSGNVVSLDFPTTSGSFGEAASSDRENGFFTRLSGCCLEVINNELSPETQEACIQATPYLLDGEDAVFAGGFPDILRARIAFSQEGIARPGQYTWEQSEDGENWTVIDGARDRSYQPEPSVSSRFFRRIVGCDTSNIISLIINDKVAPGLDPGGPFILCPGSDITLGGQPTVSEPNGAYALQWSPADVLNNAEIDNPLASPFRTTVFQVEVIDDEGCRVVKNTSVFLLQPFTGGSVRMCAGDTIRIGNSPLPAEVDIQYTWSVLNGDLNAIQGSTQVPRLRVAPQQDTWFKLTVSLEGLCTFEDSILVRVDSPLFADAGVDQVICQGSALELGSNLPPNPDWEYRWFPSAGLSQNNIARPQFDGRLRSACGQEQFVLEVRDRSGICPAARDTVRIDILVADAGKDGCGPRLLGTPDRSCNRFQYQWVVLEGDASSIVGQETLPQPFVDPNQPTTYQLTVSHQGQTCTSTVFVPGCECPQVSLSLFVPIDCETKEQRLPFCVDLPDAPGFDITLINPDAFVAVQGNQLCLLEEISQVRSYSIRFDRGFVSCISTISFVPDVPEVPSLDNDSLFICPQNQGPNAIQIGTEALDGYSYLWAPARGLQDPESATTLLDWTQLNQRKTTYTLQVTHDATQCVFPLQLDVFLQTPIADAGPDRDFCGGIFAVLGTADRNNFQYEWTPQDGLNNAAVAQPELSLFAGPGNYVYTVRVTDPNTGCFDTDQVVVRVLEDITADAGPDIEICAGQTVQIGNPSAPTIGYSYRWSPETGLSDPRSPAPLASPQENIQYTLSVRLDGGTPCEAIDQVNITVRPSQVVNVDVGPDLQACEIGIFVIGPEPTAGFTYQWTPVNGLNNPSLPQPEVTVDSSTFYVLTVVNTETCEIGSDTVFVNLDQLPPLAGPDRSICKGESTQLGQAMEPGVSYFWTPGLDPNEAELAQPIVSPQTSTTFILTYERNGCQKQDTVEVIVIEAPLADAGPDQVFCETPVMIGPAVLVPNVTYVWTPTIGLDDPNSSNPMANPNQEQTYILFVTDQNGCIASDTVVVRPSFDVQITQQNYNTCLGDSIQIGLFEADVDLNYQWIPSSFLDDPNSAMPLFFANEAGQFEVQLIVSDGNCERRFVFTISVEDPGAIDFDQNVLNACKDGCVDVTTNIQGSFTSFFWSPATGVNQPQSPNTSICPQEDGFYILTGINERTRCIVRDTLWVNVSETPAPPADAGPDLFLCRGNGVQLGTIAQVGLDYQWTPSTHLNSTSSAQPTFNSTEGGVFSYQLRVYDEVSNCTSIDEVNIEVVDFNISIQAPNSICANSPFTLQANLIDNPFELSLSEFSFEWTPAHVLNDALINAPRATIDSATLFFVRVIHVPTGCEREASILVSVDGAAIPEIDLPEEIVFCDRNTPFRIPLEPQPGFTYRWQPAFRLSNPNIANPVIQTPVPIGNIYQLTYTDNNRTDVCRTGVVQLRLLESTIPEIEDRAYTFCEGSLDQIIIGPDAEEVQAALSFEWLPATGLSSTTVANPTAPTDRERSFLLNANYTNTPARVYAHCTSSAVYDILPLALPTVNAGGDRGLCEPGTLRVGGPVNPFLTYRWSPESLVDDPTAARPLASLAQPARLFLEVTDENGCSNIDSIQLIISEIDIVLNTFINVSCDDEQMGAIAVSALGGVAPYTFLWTTVDGSGLAPSLSSQTGLSAGAYTVLVTDAAGCTASATYTLDTEEDCCDAILFTSVPEDISIGCNESIDIELPQAAGHCCEGGIQVTVEIEVLSGPCAGSSIERRIFTASDACGNVEVWTQQVFKVDTVAPELFLCEDRNLQIECSAQNEQTILQWHLQNEILLYQCASDDCSPHVWIESNFNDAVFIQACGASGQISVEYWALDLCGNSSDTLTFTLQITDQTAPSLSSCEPRDVTLSCDAGALTTLLNNWHAANTIALLDCASDVCSASVFLGHNFNPNQFVPNPCGIGGSLTVQYRAIDLCGNTSEPFLATITIIDDQAPNVSLCVLPNETLDCSVVNFPQDAISWHENNLALIAACASDNCAAQLQITHDFDPNNFEITCGVSGQLVVQYFVSDPCGNVALPLIASWSIGDEGNLEILPCNLDLDVVLQCEGQLLNQEILDWHAANIIAIEACGQSSCAGAVQVTSDFDLNNFIFLCGQTGSITVSYSVGNGCSDEVAVLSATFVYQDIAAPDLSSCSSLPPLLIDCETAATDVIQQWHDNNISILQSCAQDACDDIVNIESNIEDLDLSLACGATATISVFYLVSDECGNTADTLFAFVTLENNSAPDLSACNVSDVTISCADGDLSAQALAWHLDNLNELMSCASNACNEISAIIDDFAFNPEDFDCQSSNTLVVNYQLEDACGQLSDPLTLVITINQIPELDLSDCDLGLGVSLTCGDDFELLANEWHNQNLLSIQACLTDVCDGVFEIGSDFSIPSNPDPCATSDTLSVNYYVLNICGDTLANISAQLLIEDNEAPVITWNDDAFGPFVSGDTLFVECEANVEGWDLPAFGLGSVSAVDNCSEDVQIEMSEEIEGSGNCSEDGFFYRIRCVWTATDDCGNQDSLVLFIQIQDSSGPQIHGVPADITVNCDQIPEPPLHMNCPDDPDACCADKVWVSDACECAELLYEETSIWSSCEDSYTLLRTWTAIDNCGNSSTATQEITVLRTLEPAFTVNHLMAGQVSLGDTLEVFCQENGGFPDWVFQLNSDHLQVSNVCPGEPFTLSYDLFWLEEASDCIQTGYLQALSPMWTYFSPCGQVGYFYFTIVLKDLVAPEIQGLPLVCLEEAAQVHAMDACSDNVSLSFEEVQVPSLCTGTSFDNMRIWTATDACGNSSQFEQRIIDTQGQDNFTVIPQNLLLQGLSSGDTLELFCNPQASSLSGFVASDVMIQALCGGPEETMFAETIMSSGTCEDGFAYTLELRWTIEDICQGQLHYVLYARLKDETAPVFEEEVILLSCGEPIREPEVADACTSITLELLSEQWLETVDCEEFLDLQRVYRATDECGNASTATISYRIIRDGGVQFSGVPGGVVCNDTSIPTVSALDLCTQELLTVVMEERMETDPCSRGDRLIRTWIATDACGSTHQASQVILIGDDLRPEIRLQHPIYGNIQDGASLDLSCVPIGGDVSLDFSSANVTSIGNCVLGVTLERTALDAGDCSQTNIVERERLVWTATDQCNNIEVLEIQVDWLLGDAPKFLDPPQDITVGCGAAPLPEIPELAPSCTEVQLDFQESSYFRGVNQEVYRVWKARDACGNETLAEQLIVLSTNQSLTCNFGEFIEPVCNTQGNALTVYPQGGTAPYTYHWEVLGGVCDIQFGQGTPTIIYSIGFSRTNIRVTITDATGCQTSCDINFNCVIDPKERAEEGTSFEILFGGAHPNPAHNEVFIHYGAARNQKVRLSIADAFGTIVRREEQVLNFELRELRVSLADLPAGMYYITMIGEDGKPHSEKIIKY